MLSEFVPQHENDDNGIISSEERRLAHAMLSDENLQGESSDGDFTESPPNGFYKRDFTRISNA